MSTGISISSINRIKELAEEKKFAEALEILDTQNLDKSINPQFLRISGEIFRENKRYYDSRRILMKAHQMSPQGNRIIYELIQLYLELGYFTKADKYYEQYLFNSGAEDTQKDYVEYIMKKAKGAEIKELASILLPILERMPEDKWNFEAVLLYDKMDRKDKALDESRYILENFKESIFVQPVIEYIDDKLDVDKWFYVYPHEEQEEDTELFGNLIEEEEKLLEADYLRMYPPEARIMVEAEDKDALEQRPVKDKKTKKKKKKDADDSADSSMSDLDEYEEPEDRSVQDIIREAEMLMNPDYKPEDIVAETEDSARKQTEDILQEEIKIKEEREAALEKLLSKKIDKDKIKESAKQVAQAVKEIDTTKAKNQVKSVADSVMDNVKKATDAIGEAVGTKQTGEEQISNIGENTSEEIMDGIIESVLEPPKKTVGQVIMNEELDAMIPDSLEAMSKEEIADIEARKEEEERLELEALEASLELAEKKKAKSRRKKSDAETQEADENETEDNQIVQGGISGEQLSYTGESYTELKEKFLAEMQAEEEQPLDSLGFITVVHSDVDETMEEAMPDAAGMLRQMIDNKEFYTGEDSRGFESKVSYDNHGFEVEDFDFEEYRESDIEDENIDKTDGMHDSQIPLTVEVIYAQEQVVDFDEIVPDEPIVRAEKPAPIEQMATEPEARWEVPVDSEVRWEAPDEPEAKQETSVEPEVKWEEPD
ncbi:MAG: hypothetical protein K2K56_04970, partial [Lachnospiraceae bacterium]|nr:hypothetical protein [Lachnospiraceae bacterium]